MLAACSALLQHQALGARGTGAHGLKSIDRLSCLGDTIASGEAHFCERRDPRRTPGRPPSLPNQGPSPPRAAKRAGQWARRSSPSSTRARAALSVRPCRSSCSTLYSTRPSTRWRLCMASSRAEGAPARREAREREREPAVPAQARRPRSWCWACLKPVCVRVQSCVVCVPCMLCAVCACLGVCVYRWST